MRSRLVMILAIVLAATAVAVTGTRFITSTPDRPVAVHASLAPTLASYLGVFEPGAPPGYSAVAAFAEAVRRQPNLAGYYSGWAQSFDTSFAEMLRTHGVIPFVQIDPTDASVAAIAAGTYDEYLRSFADSVRDFGHSAASPKSAAVVIGFGHEMNASWSTWGYGHVPAATFVAAWRHIVTLFRHEGADNVTWLWTLQADDAKTGPALSWWPGGQYVTWVGIDGYYTSPSDTFASLFGKTITQVRAFTNTPVLLSETAVAPAAVPFVKIPNLFQGIAAYSTLGLVWFDKDQQGDPGTTGQDWRIEDNSQAEIAFSLGVSEYLTRNPPAG